ncbi:MAG: hypothetical protein ACI4KA_09750 [Oscillospiraceae bacterium]
MKKFKSLMKKAKALIAAAAVAVTTAVCSVCASAETGEASTDLLKVAGDTLVDTFEGLIATMIPVIMGIMSAGLVVFGIIALVKLAKKIFGKVAG